MISQSPLEAPTGPAAFTRYALLTMDGLQLLMPQNQVHALEPSFDVQYPDTGGVGWITVAGLRSPVYCLSEDLKPLRKTPASRPICVLLDGGAGLFGVLCDEVTMFEQDEPNIAPLPACMRTPGTPLRGVVLDGEQVLCVGSADGLLPGMGDQQEPVAEPDRVQALNGGVV